MDALDLELTLGGALLLDLIIVRVISSGSRHFAYLFATVWLVSEIAAAGGLILGGGIIFFEIRLERVSLSGLIAPPSERAGNLRRLSDVAGSQPGECAAPFCQCVSCCG